MKLVLIIPPSPWMISDRDQLCLGPLYVSSFLKAHGHEVQVVDLAGIPEEYWYFPVGDIYGVTGVTPQFVYMKKIIDRLKEREPNKKVVVGGVHATVAMNHIFKNTQADDCIRGEGEITMLNMMENKIQKEIAENIDSLPFPDRESCDYFSYLIPGIHKFVSNAKREAKIITSRGCPYDCAFCASKKIWGRKVRYRSSENVAEEFAMLKQKYAVDIVNVIDDTFTVNKDHVSKICDHIRPLEMKWYCLSRPDCIDEGLLKEMKSAGCESVTFGFESGSDRILELINKKTTVSQAHKAIKMVKKAGIKIRGQIMVGLPTETEKDVELTADFIEYAKDVDVFGIHVFRPYPGTDIWDNPDKYNIEIDKDTDFSDWHTCGKRYARLSKDEKIQGWYEYLCSVAGTKDITRCS